MCMKHRIIFPLHVHCFVFLSSAHTVLRELREWGVRRGSRLWFPGQCRRSGSAQCEGEREESAGADCGFSEWDRLWFSESFVACIYVSYIHSDFFSQSLGMCVCCVEVWIRGRVSTHHKIDSVGIGCKRFK